MPYRPVPTPSAAIAFAGASLLMAITGCSQSTSAAPPTVICGHTLPTSAAGAFVVDATHAGTRTVTSTSPGGVIQIRLSSDCSRGAAIQLVPSDRLRIVARAPAEDGNLAGVELRPRTGTSAVVVTHSDGHVTRIKIRLAGE